MDGYTISKVNAGYLVTNKTAEYNVPQMWAFSTLKEVLKCVEELFSENDSVVGEES